MNTDRVLERLKISDDEWERWRDEGRKLLERARAAAPGSYVDVYQPMRILADAVLLGSSDPDHAGRICWECAHLGA